MKRQVLLLPLALGVSNADNPGTNVWTPRDPPG